MPRRPRHVHRARTRAADTDGRRGAVLRWTTFRPRHRCGGRLGAVAAGRPPVAHHGRGERHRGPRSGTRDPSRCASGRGARPVGSTSAASSCSTSCSAAVPTCTSTTAPASSATPRGLRDAVAIPPGARWRWSDWSDDLGLARRLPPRQSPSPPPPDPHHTRPSPTHLLQPTFASKFLRPGPQKF